MDANPQPDAEQSPDEPENPAIDNAVRSPGEIGGKKFRVGLDDEYVPFRNRTKRRRKAVAMALGGLLILGVGAYGLVNLVTAPVQNAAAACKAVGAGQEQSGLPAQAAANSAPAKFTLNVYNSTNRRGLAATTAAQLKQRGFAIGQITNDPLKANLAISAQVRGSKGQQAELHEVAAEVPGAQIQSDDRTDPSVDLVLGTGFTSLASAQQVNAAMQAAQALASASAASAASSACAR